MIRLLGCCLATILLGSCAATMPDRTTPPLPEQWHHTSAAGTALHDAWWQAFNSTELNRIILEARLQNLDLAAAAARVKQAGARARISAGYLWPSLTAYLDAGRDGAFDTTVADASGNSFGVGLLTSYELDLWGKLRANRDSSRSQAAADRFERDALQLSVTAEVAAVWLQAAALRERAVIAKQNMRNAVELSTLAQSRFSAGAATLLETTQQKALVANRQQSLIALLRQSDDARTRLNELLGRTCGADRAVTPFVSLQIPPVAAGLPSELLARRPDIARAEALLSAADADVAAARAALLPDLNLTIGLSSSGDRALRIFENPLYSLAAALTAPIFNAGRLVADKERATARREELLYNYRQTIVTAFAEVETALNAARRLDEQIAFQAEELALLQHAYSLTEQRYRVGAETMLNVLEAQRSLYAAQDLAVQLKLARLQAGLDLIKALGGGWQKEG